MTTAEETEVIAQVMREQKQEYDRVISLSFDEAPEITGNYGVYDGLDLCGGGVTRNIRGALRSFAAGRNLKRPIFEWTLDKDGSVELWLQGKIRCSRCDDVVEILELERHIAEYHGEEGRA